MPYDDLRIEADRIGPLRRNRTDCAVVKAQQQAPAFTVGPLADAGACPSAEWMKGVGYKNMLRAGEGNVRFLR